MFTLQTPSPTFIYPVDNKINYGTDVEYRKSLRELFKMNNQSVDPSLDEISKDENNYDEETMKLWMNWIIEQTKECYELNELYKLAAATMISLDKDTGLAVLFSFDYFSDFHSLLTIYFKNPNQDLEMSTSYERLWKRLSKN
jgi:hypothetical protein